MFQVLLFSSVTSKAATKISFFAYYLAYVHLHYHVVFKDNKLRSPKNIEIKVFLNLFLAVGKIRIRTRNYRSGFGIPIKLRILRIRIRKTVKTFTRKIDSITFFYLHFGGTTQNQARFSDTTFITLKLFSGLIFLCI